MAFSKWIVAIRGEKGSYNPDVHRAILRTIVAFRGEKGSYNISNYVEPFYGIVAIRGEKGSYNVPYPHSSRPDSRASPRRCR